MLKLLIEKCEAIAARIESLWWFDNYVSSHVEMFKAYLDRRYLLFTYRITLCNRMLLWGYQLLTGITNLAKVAKSCFSVYQFMESF